MADSIFPSVAMLYAWGEKESREGALLTLENLYWARLWMKKLSVVAREPRLSSICLHGKERRI